MWPKAGADGQGFSDCRDAAIASCNAEAGVLVVWGAGVL